MATAPALRNQIEAIKKRIDAVAPTASPEDVVMLAKSIEAIGGQATVFDVMDAGVSARNEALMLIDEAKNTALTEIVKAVGITDELKAEHVALRADMAGLFDRTDLTPLVLPPGGAVLPDPARGVYALTPTDYTASSVTLPDYADGSGALKSHLLLNGGDVPVRVFDASGNAVGTIPARGASVVFAVESGGVWSWLATRSAPGSQSLIIDTPLILLDNKGVDFLELRAMNGGFLACWTKNYIPSACFLKWAAGTLVPGPISTRTYGDPYVYAHSLVKIHETRAALFWRYRDVIYYIFLDIGADGAVTFGEAKALLTGLNSSHNLFSVCMESETSGMVFYGEYINSSPARYGTSCSRLSVSSDSIGISGGRVEIGTVSSSVSNSKWLSYIHYKNADMRKGKALFAGMSPEPPRRLYAYDCTPSTPVLLSNVEYSSTFNVKPFSSMVRFLRDDLALVCWVGDDSAVFWRLVALENGTLKTRGVGLVNTVGFHWGDDHNDRMALLVLSESSVALVIAARETTFPKIVFGTVSADAAGVFWSEWTELPFLVTFNSFVDAEYDPQTKSFLVAEYNGSTSPIALTAKL